MQEMPHASERRRRQREKQVTADSTAEGDDYVQPVGVGTCSCPQLPV